jgi:hypothetical protein
VLYVVFYAEHVIFALAPPPQLQAVQREFLANRSYREIAELRRPLVLSGIVVDRWQARSSFTSSFLAQKLTHVMAHRQESSRSFMTFHDNKPLESLVNERWEDFNVKVNVTLPEVLNWHNVDHNLSSGPYLYFSQDIATLRSVFPDIMDHVQPIDDLILSPDNVQVNLWIGRAGIVTHTHYDCTFNFFVQLHGRKRFTLSPPDSPMYLYPCLHPHYGHSQVDILGPNPTTFPHFSMDGSRVAEVAPGDMLVVPPFWFHHVETLEESVSVNVWSDAPEYALINQIYEQPIPFEENWGWRVMATATKIYTEMLLQSLEVTDSCQFIGKLIEQVSSVYVYTGVAQLPACVESTMCVTCAQSRTQHASHQPTHNSTCV